jgi:hypothetical protein
MAIKTPGSVNQQSGSGGPNVKTAGVRKGGKNQGKVAGGVRLNTAHPRKMGQ